MHPECKAKKVKEAEKVPWNNFKRDEWKGKQRKGASLPEKSRKRPGGVRVAPRDILVSSGQLFAERLWLHS